MADGNIYIDDEEILRLIRDSKKSMNIAVTYLYHKHDLTDTIKWFVQHNSGSPEDVRSIKNLGLALFVKKVIKEPYFVPDISVVAYVVGIAKNLWLKELRKKSERSEVSLEQIESSIEEESFEEQYFTAERRQKLSVLLHHLSDKCREVLMMWSASYKMKEIAEYLGYKSEGMAKKKKWKCFHELMDLLKENPTLLQELK